MNNMQMKKGRKPKEKRYDTKFANVLRNLLAEKEESGVSLTAAADGLGITRQSLAQYRDGHNIPDIVILGRMADYFDVTTDYLLGRTSVRTSDVDAQKFCEKTKLSENVFENLCVPRSELETDTLNAFFEDNWLNICELSAYVLDKYDTQAFRAAVFNQFVKENNLPISDKLIEERGESSLKYVLSGDKYFYTAARLEFYFQDKAEALNVDVNQEDLKDFRLQSKIKQMVESTISFFYSSKTAEYLDCYYPKLLEFLDNGDNQEIAELKNEKKQFCEEITKGGLLNGSNNPKKE